MGLEINERIKKYRKQKNISEKELAKRLGIKYSTYCRMESKAKRIEPSLVVEIAKILGIDPDLIIYGENMLDFSPAQSEPVVFKTPTQNPFEVEEIPLVLSHKCGEFEISNEEKQMIVIFRNASEEKKEKLRELIQEMI